MNQVFVSNNRAGQIASAKVWTDMVHLATGDADGSATAMFGVWDPYAQVFLDGTTAALSLINPHNLASANVDKANATWAKSAQGLILADTTDMADDSGIVNVAPSSPQWLNSQFQLVQAMPSGNPVASPIIHTRQVKRLRWDLNAAPTLHKIDVQSSDLASIAVGDTLQLVVSLRFPGDISFYEAQVNPSGSVTNVTPAISAAFDNPKRIYKSREYTAATATVNTEHNAFADQVIADNASGVNPFSDFITTTLATNDLDLTSKFFGAIIEATVIKNGVKSHVASETTAMLMGVGSFAEVLSAEKKAQYSQGHFNRMYLPTGGVTHASQNPGNITSTQTLNYDRIVLDYVNPNGTMPGFNKQASESRATIYVPSNGDRTTQAEGLAVEATWGLINAHDGSASVEYNW